MPIPRLVDVKYHYLCQFLKVSAETIFFLSNIEKSAADYNLRFAALNFSWKTTQTSPIPLQFTK